MEKFRFIIRDDDLNYFSMPEDVERWYADVFAQGIPVGFAVIPFVKPSSDVYPFYPPSEHTPTSVEDKEYPLSLNTELVEYVKNNPHIEVMMHGCTHETKDGVYEYAQQRDLIGDTLRGKEELTHAFGEPPRIFVPPHDWINTAGVKGIEAARLHLIRGRGAGLRNWLWRWQYATIFLLMLVFRFPRYISMAPPVYPYLLNFGKHKELCSYRLEDPDVFEGLEQMKKANGIFVVVAHVHTLNEDKKERLRQLIDRARSLGAEFVGPNDVFA